MNDSRVNKILKFEGAGWAGADTSKATDLENCRIRTTFINDFGEKIYFELGVYDNRKFTSQTKWHKGFSMPWHINFLFYTRDKGRSCSPEFQHEYYQVREFTKENVLKFINHNCRSSFEKVETVNWHSNERLATDQYWNGFSHTGKTEDDFHNEE